MPRIKRWSPISHDFNRDPEIIEMRQRFGDWTALAWQEVLHEADRNDGMVRGTIEQIAFRLAPISLRKYSKTAQKLAQNLLEFAQKLGWIAVETGHIRVVNHWKYHRNGGLRVVPTKPNHTKPEPNHTDKKKEEEPQVAPIVPPDCISKETWSEYLAMRKRKHAKVTPEIARRLFSKLETLWNLGHEPNDVLRTCIDRNWTGLEIDWIHKNGAQNGKRPSEPKGFAAIREVLRENQS